MLAELGLGIFILAFSGIMFYQTTQLDFNSKVASIGPDYWPQIILGGMLALSALLIVDTVRRKGILAGGKPAGRPPKAQNLWFTLALMLMYTYAMQYLGFVLATLLFLLAAMWMLELRKPKTLAALALGVTTALVVLFPILMMIPLPRGTGLFRTISLLFY
ncbi:MAG: tripartite tricarboxylate transporter TctB family protein [Firmicutes bacterium]|nr:tripartite tricarboxylate transporter TctB family protein [Bacillota bacterium]